MAYFLVVLWVSVRGLSSKTYSRADILVLVYYLILNDF